MRARARGLVMFLVGVAAAHEGDESGPCAYTCGRGLNACRPGPHCRIDPSCSTLDGGGAASDYLELTRLSLVGATSLFSPVVLKEDARRPNARTSGILINSGYLRARNLQCLLQGIRDSEVPGEFVECGVWRGGMVIFMASFVQAFNLSRTVWGFDSFMGVPSRSSGLRDKAHDRLPFLHLAVSQAQVDSHVRQFGLTRHVRLVAGWFNRSITLTGQQAALRRRGIALLRVDGDLYSSTMQVLVRLYPLVSRGGWVVLDDWAVPEARAAIGDYRRAHNITEPITFHTGLPMRYAVARWQKKS